MSQQIGTTLPGAVWNPRLLMSGPAEIFSQNVSQGIPLAFWQTSELPASIPVEPAPPIFRSEVEQLDLFRVLLLVLGVVIGAKVLR